jgi:hypothetical protein
LENMVEKHLCRNFQSCTRYRDEPQRPGLRRRRRIGEQDSVANPREIEWPWRNGGRFPLSPAVKIGCARVGSRIVRISGPESDKSYHQWEFNHLYCDDHRLSALALAVHELRARREGIGVAQAIYHGCRACALSTSAARSLGAGLRAGRLDHQRPAFESRDRNLLTRS